MNKKKSKTFTAAEACAQCQERKLRLRLTPRRRGRWLWQKKPLLKRSEVLKKVVPVREAGIGSLMTNYHGLRKVKMRRK
jgi:hypothetical protein